MARLVVEDFGHGLVKRRFGGFLLGAF